jgi:hypothetical protein
MLGFHDHIAISNLSEPLYRGTTPKNPPGGAPPQLEAYEGPLDLLLELAAQFAGVVESALADRTVPLPRLAEWLIMAAWLTLLRSRPPGRSWNWVAVPAAPPR